MESRAREVLTLQLGHYANFVGTHWWNIQESSFVYSPAEADGPKEINHDVLFREGQNMLGEITFTPRLIAVDLKGSLNTLKQEGQLYDVASPHHGDDVLWGDDVTLHQMESGQKNEFLQDLQKFDSRKELASWTSQEGTAATPDDNSSPESDRDESVVTVGQETALSKKQYALEDSISVWSDFLRPHLHPKSIHLLCDYHHQNELRPFDMFGYGRQVAGADYEALDDRLHYFLEECDHLQGIHMLVDTHNGFGGLGTSLIEHLKDDYGTESVLIYGLTPPSFNTKKCQDHGYRILNSVLAFSNLTSCGAAFVPLTTDSYVWQQNSTPVTLPYLQHKSDLWYHTSAILGASVDTMTLPYRLHTTPSLLSHMTDALTAGGRKILGLQTSLPFPFLRHSDLFSSLMALGGNPPWRPITPLYSSNVAPYAQSVVLRGIRSTQIKGSILSSMPREIRQAESADEVLEMYLRETFTYSLSGVCTIRQPTKVVAPFPNMFTAHVSHEGHINTAPGDTTQAVESVPMMSSLQTSSCAVALLEMMVKKSGHLKLNKFHNLVGSGVEGDEYEEAINGLQTLCENYRAHPEGIF